MECAFSFQRNRFAEITMCACLYKLSFLGLQKSTGPRINFIDYYMYMYLSYNKFICFPVRGGIHAVQPAALMTGY